MTHLGPPHSIRGSWGRGPSAYETPSNLRRVLPEFTVQPLKIYQLALQAQQQGKQKNKAIANSFDPALSSI